MNPESGLTVLEGTLVADPGDSYAIVASRFNELIVGHLTSAAIDALVRHGVALANIVVVKVPGAWEIPVACAKIAAQKKVAAILAVGCVIRGGTPHFEHVAGEVASGVSRVAATYGIPVAFGVLTTDSIEQAIERAGTKMGNKGWDAALTALEMVSLGRALDAHGS